MYIVSYYIFTAIYTYLFTLIFNLDFTNPGNPWLYLLIVVAIIIGFILSFLTQVLFLYLFGVIRTNSKFDSKVNHRFANALLRLGLHIMRVKVVISGKENIPSPNEQFVLVGNHQENYDIIILKPIFKDHILNFIAKEALTKAPIIGRWIRLLGSVFISRNADRSAAESIVRGIRNIKNGTSMGIFPEGKRSFGNEMIDFKPGAFKLAMKPKADLLIATQYNTCKIFKTIPWKRYRVYVHIHPVLKYEDYEGLNSHEVSAKVKGIIQEKLDEFEKKLGK